ncbi:hypothetical protein BP6252_08210 [Coleophoma cylindrospora]|uniref:ASST-domain-containing protein n=1 Tax=Coleophoma cylindrospora TaxID=1849047 RepID=A0A3D8R5F6_9HELO|nr:hypothetical protein BP6252_08210 [Coleophoma cylindrospora]
MDKHYQVVKTIQSHSHIAGFDLHEFRLTLEGTALVTAYVPRLHSSIWVLDCIFQEISLDDSLVLFEWSALDHIDDLESRVPRGTYPLVGNGLHNDNGWDYFHINSVDKSNAGDYLISSRHTDCIFKISKIDGSIIWRLNGDHSSFALEGFTFKRQHHARFQEESKDRTVISLFNNDNDGYSAKGLASTGMIIEIHHLSKVARKIAEFQAPVIGGMATPGSGSLSFIPDGNILVCWGIDSAIAEFLPDGTPTWYAHIQGGAWNYRAYKGSWVGEPLHRPALWTYCISSIYPTNFYVSWNGATNVRLWQFYVSDFEDGPYQLIGSQAKIDFETVYSYSAYHPWTFVEAIGMDSSSLGNSSVTKTLVVGTNATSDCGLPHCSGNDEVISLGGHIWDKSVVEESILE